MKWAEFLKILEAHDRVTLVGPLQDRIHEPTCPTIYVDGGGRFASPSAKSKSVDNPVVFVGDGDSGPEVALDEVLPADKDFSDLAFALRALPQSVIRVEMLGFLGGRRDHELCNFGEVHAFLSGRSHFTVVEMIGEDSLVIGFCKGRVEREIHGDFSVFVLQPTAPRIWGACQYPLNRERTLEPLSSAGLSNLGSGRVEIESGSPAFVLVPGPFSGSQHVKL